MADNLLLLKSLLKKSVYNKFAGSKLNTVFEGDLEDIYRIIVYAHEKYEGDLSVSEIKTLLLTLSTYTTTRTNHVKFIFDKLEETEDAKEDIISDIINTLLIKSALRNIANICVEGLNGKVTKDSLLKIGEVVLEDVTVEEGTEEVDLDLDTLMSFNDPSNRMVFNIASLQEKTNGIGAGHNVIVFGRPEVGKSSFVAYVVSGFLSQNKKVLYFCNEEPGDKIALNIVRAITNKGDAELEQDKAAAKEMWNEARKNLKLVDCYGASLMDMEAKIKKETPDIVVFDQTDKIVFKEGKEAHARLKDLYSEIRVVGKRNAVAIINVSQASIDAEGKMSLTMGMLENSKTGKAGEADLIIGIGRRESNALVDDGRRYLGISKNKLTGYHGVLPTIFDHVRCQWISA